MHWNFSQNGPVTKISYIITFANVAKPETFDSNSFSHQKCNLGHFGTNETQGEISLTRHGPYGDKYDRNYSNTTAEHVVVTSIPEEAIVTVESPPVEVVRNLLNFTRTETTNGWMRRWNRRLLGFL